ncbi:hypothetical protein CBR_g47094 [Chara braunii]|uniref:Peptidase A2 domain-containing protein n=1 Tax=Chara braunii TaxID=69332 RepID=A0A388M1L3_CHABU|nr:hypothetical protein CBR_g47094 [Chara braunii]|eukprot:GBG88395.1 hypothetical protein CBR_g47094 [Chara braunii]
MGSPNLAENDSLGDERRNDIQELTRLIRQTTTSHEKFPKIKVPLFDGENVTDWLEKYELNAHVRQWTEWKMLEVVKCYVHVDVAEELGEMACRTRIWKTFRERMLEKYELGDGLLDVSDLRKLGREKFETIEGFLKRFEKVAKRVPDFPDKTKCIIFLTNFTEVEQRELMKGFTTRYDWDKIKANLKVGDFDQMLYHLLRRQRKIQEDELVSCDKDKEMFGAIMDVRMIMKEMRKELLCGKVITVRQQDGKRKGKARAEESDEEDSEKEEEEEPPRKATKVERKAMNQNGEGKVRMETKPRIRMVMGMIIVILSISIRDNLKIPSPDNFGRKAEEAGGVVGELLVVAVTIVYTNIRGEVFDFEGNLIDSYIEGGMRKEAFRRMNRTMPCTYRLTSKEEMKILESREVARQAIVSRSDVSKGKTEKERDVRKALSSRSGLKTFGGQVKRQGLDMEKLRLGMPNMFLLGGHDGRRGVAPLAPSLSALRVETPSSSHLQTTSAGTRSVLNRPVLRRGTSPAVPQAQKIKKRIQPRVAPVVSAKAQQEVPVVIVEEDLDTEDEKLRAEDERQARLRAQKRGLDENQDKEKDEGDEEEHQKKKNRYTIPIEEGIDIEKMVDRTLESHRDLVTLKECLAASPKIREELKQRLTRRKVMTVKLGEVIPPEANWTPAGAKMDWRCVATGHVMVKIGVSQHLALVDTGAEMNILRENEAFELGIEIDRTDNGFMVGAGGSTPFCGTASNVSIQIDKVKGGKGKVKLQFEMASSSRQDKVQKMVRTAIARLSEKLAAQEKGVSLFIGDNVEEFIDLFTKLANKEQWTEDQMRDQVARYSNE